jgi:SulP family sulfate permease
MLLLLGFSLIHEWVVTSRKRLPWPDYMIIVSIFLVIGLFGFMQGVAFGLAAAVVLFVIRFSRVPVVGNIFTALDRRSVKERPVPHRKILSAEGGRVQGYELTGYLFFGSAATLVQSLNGVLTSEPRPDFVLLDFNHISGFDVSAVTNFHRFALNAGAVGSAIAIAAAPDRLKDALERNLPRETMSNIKFFPDADHALEWCEDRLIERALANGGDEASVRDVLFHQSVDDLMAHLERQERFEHLVESLRPWLEHREHPSGSVILEKGEYTKGLHLLIQGAATEMDPDSGVRIRSLAPGCVFAAAGAFGGYTAPTTIRADSDCTTAFLSVEARGLLERESMPHALALYGFIIQS